MNLYKILGVSPDADYTIIKRRYRELAKELHPDRTKGDPVKERKFKEVAAAYAILGNEQRRALYDRKVSTNDGKTIFGVDFDELVDRIKTEGVSQDNIGDLLDDFLTMAKNFQEEAPSRIKKKADETGSLMGLVNDLFGFDEVEKKR